jgi:hypothetical protein
VRKRTKAKDKPKMVVCVLDENMLREKGRARTLFPSLMHSQTFHLQQRWRVGRELRREG